jgi:hypothetical protein
VLPHRQESICQATAGDGVPQMRDGIQMNLADFITAFPTTWQKGPAPQGPLLVRNHGAAVWTFHRENWLLKEIHGADYEWSLPRYP